MSLIEKDVIFDGMDLEKVSAVFESKSGLAGCFEHKLEVIACVKHMYPVLLKDTYTDLDGEVYGDEPEVKTFALNRNDAVILHTLLGNALKFLESQDE